MRTGLIISLAGHALLFVAILVGDWLGPEREAPKLEITDVAIVSEEELARMAGVAPVSVPTERPDAPAVPSQTEAEAPRLPATTGKAIPSPRPPEMTPPAGPEARPERVTAPVAPDDVSLPERPVIGRNATAQTGPLPPQPVPGEVERRPEGPVGSPELLAALDEGPRFVPKVDKSTPRPDKAPRPDAEEVASRPDEKARETPREKRETGAPEEAAPTPVAEAEAGLGRLAPAKSQRPRGRPPRPSAPEPASTERRVAEAGAEASPDQPQEEFDPIAAMIAQAETTATSARGMAASTPSLDPDTVAGIRGTLRQCWNVGGLSEEAKRIVVTLKVRFEPDGRLVASAIEPAGISPGSDKARRAAYDAARRAVILCSDKLELPADRYEAWKEMEITFDLANMGFE